MGVRSGSWDWERIKRNPELLARIEAHRQADGTATIPASLANEVEAWLIQDVDNERAVARAAAKARALELAAEGGKQGREANRAADQHVEDLRRQRLDAEAETVAAMATLRALVDAHKIKDTAANGKLIEAQIGNNAWTKESVQAAFEAVKDQLERVWSPGDPLPDNPSEAQMKASSQAEVKRWLKAHDNKVRAGVAYFNNPGGSFGSKF